MRVVAGEKRGQRLVAPPGRNTRPTSDRVREAMFSMLGSLEAIAGASVWDLFAGSGALGIEALSRGASRATLVEQAPAAVAAARSNLATLGYGPDRARVVCSDVLSWLSPERRDVRSSEGVDVVFADPPYSWEGWDTLLAGLVDLAPLVVMQAGQEVLLPEEWRCIRCRRYGTTVVTLTRTIDRVRACPMEEACEDSAVSGFFRPVPQRPSGDS